MNGTITGTEQRPGVVTAISPDSVTVHLQQQSACCHCHARDLCVSTECRDLELRLESHGQHFTVGQSVRIVAHRRVGRLAVLLAFVLPLLRLLLAVNEGVSALLALGLLTLYYLGLYTQRQRLAGRLVLSVEPHTPDHE